MTANDPGFFRATYQSRTIPTRCRYCGAKVWFYTNELGSKVFFDELGPPWPIHSCPGYEEAHKTSSKSISGPVGRFVHTETGELVHAETYFKNQDSIRKKWDQPIIAVHTLEGQILYEIGLVRDIFPEVDIYKKFKVPRCFTWVT